MEAIKMSSQTNLAMKRQLISKISQFFSLGTPWSGLKAGWTKGGGRNPVEPRDHVGKDANEPRPPPIGAPPPHKAVGNPCMIAL